jgi:hypothetical protein
MSPYITPLQRHSVTTHEDLQDVAMSALVNRIESKVAALMWWATPGFSWWNFTNSLSSIKAYTFISSPDSFTLSWIYLSACDPTDISVYNKINSSGSKSEKHLSLFSDIFLSTKKKYKPIAKRVHPVIGKLPDKFWIKHKIIGNLLKSMPKHNPNPPSTFELTDWWYDLGTIPMHRPMQAEGFRCISVKLQQKPMTYRIQNADDSQHVQSRRHYCKGTSVCFLTSYILSYSPPVHMYSPSSPLYYSQGPYP